MKVVVVPWCLCAKASGELQCVARWLSGVAPHPLHALLLHHSLQLSLTSPIPDLHRGVLWASRGSARPQGLPPPSSATVSTEQNNLSTASTPISISLPVVAASPWTSRHETPSVRACTSIPFLSSDLSGDRKSPNHLAHMVRGDRTVEDARLAHEIDALTRLVTTPQLAEG